MVAVVDSETIFKISFFVVFLLIIGAVLYISWLGEKKRSEQLSQTAAELGMAFISRDDALRQRCADFDLLKLGGGHEVKNVIFGETQSVNVSIFDYDYTTGSGKNRSTYKQTVVLFEAADRDLPTFQLAPENILHRVAGLFGYQDLNFEAHPQFSKQYLLRGRDEEGVRALFREDVLEYFETHPELCVEGTDHQLLVYRKGRRIQPDEIQDILKEAVTVYNLFRPINEPEST